MTNFVLYSKPSKIKRQEVLHQNWYHKKIQKSIAGCSVDDEQLFFMHFV